MIADKNSLKRINYLEALPKVNSYETKSRIFLMISCSKLLHYRLFLKFLVDQSYKIRNSKFFVDCPKMLFYA